jgi:threonyl-tRNA synthetase
LTALRQELKKLGEPESYYLKAMNCPHHHRIFAAPFLCASASLR